MNSVIPNQSLFSSLCTFASSQILIRNRATDLDARMNDGTTPLVLAARLAVEGLVEELSHCHADINAVDDHGQLCKSEAVICFVSKYSTSGLTFFFFLIYL